ncbi:MAG TPA: hypothetical protein VG448_02140 [Solirubrobacterales bacterium]|nr:hypothetical protein [Solirubrobacterales bacterium]
MQTRGQKDSTDPPPLRFRLPNLNARPTKADLKVAAPPDPDIEFLKTDQGEPVWPVNSTVELEMLRDVAKVFGGRIVEVSAVPGVVEATKDEVVAGLGDEGGAEAGLYAHLTGRQSYEARSVEELDSIENLAVVLTCGPELDRDLLQWVSLLRYEKQSPGIVWGRDAVELHMQVLSSSCAAVLNGPAPTAYFGIGDRSKDGIDAMTKKVSAGAGVLHLATHGDGISQELGSVGALCQRSQVPAGDVEQAPECVHTGYCKIVDKPVTEALASGALIPPSAFAGRILVNVTCHGVSFGRQIVDPRWTTFPSLVSNPRIGAIIGVPDLSFNLNGSIEEELIAALTSGEAVGRAVARFEENPTAKEMGHHFLLFGDPAVRAVPPAATLIKQDSASRQKEKRSLQTAKDAPIPGLELLRRLAMDVKTETREKGMRTSQALLSGVDEIERAADKEEAVHGEPGRRIRKAAIEHLGTTKARLFEAWGPLAVTRTSARFVTCPYCGWRSHPKTITIGAEEPREFRMCPYCSDVEDIPPSRAGFFSLTLPRISRQPIADPDAWEAAAYVVRSFPGQTELIQWPMDSHGEPTPHLDLPPLDTSRGPIRIYAIAIEGLSIVSAAAPVTPASHKAPHISSAV